MNVSDPRGAVYICAHASDRSRTLRTTGSSRGQRQLTRSATPVTHHRGAALSVALAVSSGASAEAEIGVLLRDCFELAPLANAICSPIALLMNAGPIAVDCHGSAAPRRVRLGGNPCSCNTAPAASTSPGHDRPCEVQRRGFPWARFLKPLRQSSSGAARPPRSGSGVFATHGTMPRPSSFGQLSPESFTTNNVRNSLYDPTSPVGSLLASRGGAFLTSVEERKARRRREERAVPPRAAP